jgi:hypothetical protein
MTASVALYLLLLLAGSFSPNSAAQAQQPAANATHDSAGAAAAAAPQASPLPPGALADPRAFADRILASDNTGKLNAADAAQLLVDIRELAASLASGAARARWEAARGRRQLRIERVRRCAAGEAEHCGWQIDSEGKAKRRQVDQETEFDDRPLPLIPSPEQPSQEEGILVVAGGTAQLSNAFILLQGLRHIGCSLPMEIVYYGAGEFDGYTIALILDFDEESRRTWPGATSDAAAGGDGACAAAPGGAGGAPAPAGDRQCGAGGAAGGVTNRRRRPQPPTSEPWVRFIDGQDYHTHHLAASLAPHRAPPGGRIKGFVTKVHALCFVTTFERVLMLDADNLAVQVGG